MTIFKFTTIKAARMFCDRVSRAMQVVMGDDEKFWVCTSGDAVRLERQGYELVDRQWLK